MDDVNDYIDDINEDSINHMLSTLVNVKDPEFSASISLMQEIIKIINSKIIELEKKYKKNKPIINSGNNVSSRISY
ncbi:A30L-like protein [Finch poxvirus]|uniref:FlP194L n=4 Tax=Avipoxvirus TaxID=10260 RepID=B1A9Z8_9POXV|nr:CP194L [Vultur gryphus poxvirus]ACA14582.1 FlP194L [Flamingopox virus]UOX38823.1 A30L-like protein [Finch poxvirus]UOX39158.1 A30L-like protein [Finch poxvirus]